MTVSQKDSRLNRTAVAARTPKVAGLDTLGVPEQLLLFCVGNGQHPAAKKVCGLELVVVVRDHWLNAVTGPVQHSRLKRFYRGDGPDDHVSARSFAESGRRHRAHFASCIFKATLYRLGENWIKLVYATEDLADNRFHGNDLYGKRPCIPVEAPRQCLQPL
jgi:hypothetical protein